MSASSVSMEAIDILGLRSRRPTSPLFLSDQIEGGLPLSSLDRVAKLVAPNEPAFRYRLVAKATLARRRAARARLSSEESARLARLSRVWAFAMDVWQDADDVRGFFSRRHPMLEMRKPLDVILSSDEGATVVYNIIGALRYGSAA